ncbi:MAG: hypothetical protein ABI047_14285 [Jatrophihabitantaceae bacterium]
MSVRRGVLFDVDGTLVDTSYLHTVSWWLAFRQAGMGGDHLVHKVTDGAADDRAQGSHHRSRRAVLSPLAGAAAAARRVSWCATAIRTGW